MLLKGYTSSYRQLLRWNFFFCMSWRRESMHTINMSIWKLGPFHLFLLALLRDIRFSDWIWLLVVPAVTSSIAHMIVCVCMPPAKVAKWLCYTPLLNFTLAGTNVKPCPSWIYTHSCCHTTWDILSHFSYSGHSHILDVYCIQSVIWCSELQKCTVIGLMRV